MLDLWKAVFELLAAGGCGSLDSPERELEKLATASECDLLSADGEHGGGRESAADCGTVTADATTTAKVQLVQVTPSVVVDTSQASTVKRVVIPVEETKCCVIL